MGRGDGPRALSLWPARGEPRGSDPSREQHRGPRQGSSPDPQHRTASWGQTQMCTHPVGLGAEGTSAQGKEPEPL